MHLFQTIKNAAFILFVTCSIHAAETNKASKMTNSAIGQHPTMLEFEAPDAYYANRLV